MPVLSSAMLTVLTATVRCSTESVALYTTPIAPRPSSDWMTYRPSCGASIEPGAGLAARLDRPKDRSPDRVARFRGGEVHGRVHGESLAELVAALAFAAGDAVDEREVLVRRDLVPVAEPHVQGALQVLRRLGVLAVLVVLQTGGERRLTLGGLEYVANVAHRVGRARGEGGEGHGTDEPSNHHRNLCSILIASPVFKSIFSTWLGKVELRISIVCGPAGISSRRSGGLTPWLLPSMTISPHGVTASASRAGRPATPGASVPSCFFSPRAASFFDTPGIWSDSLAWAASGACAGTVAIVSGRGTSVSRGGGAGMICAAVCWSITDRAAMPLPIKTRNTTGAATSAERRTPNGPPVANQPPTLSAPIIRDSVCATRRAAGVPPTTA